MASSGNACLGEAAHDLIRAVLGACEDKRAVDLLAFQDLGEHGCLGRAIDPHHPLLDTLDRRCDRRHGHRGRIAQHLLGELCDGAGHRCGEEQRLPLRRKLCDDLADVVDETHVEHPVGFIEHQMLDIAQPQRIAAEEVEQASRRGDQHIDAVEQGAHLCAHGYAADHERRVDIEGGGRRS